MNAAIGDLPLERSIVLVGLMGSGKSAIGRRLAARIGMDFVDADSEIEEAAGLSINDIFEVHGEAAFRDGERRVIARLLSKPAHILATGGGAFMDPETRKTVKQRGISIWMRAEFDVLLRRVSRRDNRPLLKGDNKEEILRRLIEERYPVYGEADITVQSQDGPHEETVSEVIAAIKQFLENELRDGNRAASPNAAN
ncbi:MAG: shikimate kinase [Rhodospirillaceae bacterium]|nr:shikimate kinase [Rhodospirillaceae bacterium]MBT3627257.1 shikimate kinase [Rhodospirillaceae bacterium]MBT3927849.1 shikimate kinase [Rhodospirillaceae bacterium]MBT4428238.1 shikimate kinase [Rhodospirillaceae bacterium]MBT5778120.1 shikimate kinase [Rhodospirillaceae bacterium]